MYDDADMGYMVLSAELEKLRLEKKKDEKLFNAFESEQVPRSHPSHILNASTRQLHRRILELDLRSPCVIDTRAIRRQLTNGGDLDWRLVCYSVIPLLLLGRLDMLWWLVLFGGGLLLRGILLLDLLLLGGGGLLHNWATLSGHLALKGNYLWLLLLDRAGGVQGISCRLGSLGMGIESVLSRWASSGGCGEAAGAALEASSQTGGG